MLSLGLDIGTTACKCVAFNESFDVIASAGREYPLIHTDLGVEQDAQEWWRAAILTIREVSGAGTISSIGISSQGITFVPVDKEGNDLSNSITWLDMRADSECGFIKDTIGEYAVYQKTGKRINPAYTLPKLMWLKKHRPHIYDDTYKFLTAHDYMIMKLSGAFLTEDSLAAGSMAYDIKSKVWDRDILEICGIDIEKMPALKSSGTYAGRLTPMAAKELGLSEGVIVTAGGQDQKCAAYGAGLKEDTITVSLGTSCAVTALYDKPVLPGDMSLPCFPFIDGKSWVLEGFGSTAGASVKWFRSNFCEGGTLRDFDKSAEESYGSNNSVMFFPYLGGTGSPEWYDADSGGFTGISLDTTKGDMARAVLESTAFTIHSNIRKMESLGKRYDVISVFGGGAYSDIWLRIIADVTGKTVVVPDVRQAACLGASLVGQNCKSKGSVHKTFNPDNIKHEYYRKLYRKYKVTENSIYGR